MPGPTITTTYGNTVTIWALLHPGDARTVLISSADAVAEDGKKIVKAGTVLGSATAGDTILGDNAAAKAVNDATAEGVLVNDVDVTYQDVEGAMAYTGSININKMPVKPSDAAMAAMKTLVFMDV